MSVTIKAIEGTMTPDGRFETTKPLAIKHPVKVIVTFAVHDDDVDLAAASSKAWGNDWNNSDEDEAWATLQEAK